MNALDLLLTRQSQPRLQQPAPDGDALENIKKAALRAPDHAGLTPWQFIVCEGEGLDKLGEIFLASARANGADQTAIERAPKLPHRAPMVIVAATRYTENAKVPMVEQIESAACAVHAMQMAAFAQGFGGVWRTGSYAQCDLVKSSLGINAQEELVGFLYIGSMCFEAKPKPSLPTAEFFKSL
jgi:nitroreductase